MKNKIIVLIMFLLIPLLALAACKKQEDIPLFDPGAKETVNADSTGMFNLNKSMDSIKKNVLLPDFSTGREDGISTTYGVLLATAARNAYAYYNSVVNLNECKGSVVLFEALSNAIYATSQIEIRLVDIYDAENFVSIFFTQNPYDAASAVITAKSSAGFSALGRDNADGIAGTAGTIMYGNNFNEKIHPNFKHVPFGFGFNSATNEVTASVVYGEDFTVLGLSDPAQVGSAFTFGGFKTGEVYLQIAFRDISKNGGIVIGGIAGQNLSAKDFKPESNNIKLDMNYDDYYSKRLMKGSVSYPYSLPVPIKKDICFGETDITTALVRGGNSVAFGADYKFTPSEAGEYTVAYTAKDVYGNDIEKSYGFTVLSEPDEIEINFETKSYSVLDNVSLPGVSASGGHGRRTVSADYRYNGAAVKLDRYGKFRLKDTGSITVSVTAVDEIGQTKTGSREYVIEGGKKIVLKDGIPNGYKAGATVKLPDFDAVKYTAGSNTPAQLAKSVWVNGGEVNPAAYTVPNDGTAELNIVCYGNKGGGDEAAYPFTVKVFPSGTARHTYFAATAGGALATQSTGVQFGIPGSAADGRYDIEYPYALSASLTEINFYITAQNFDYIEIALSDFYDGAKTVKARIYPSTVSSIIRMQDASGEFSVPYAYNYNNTQSNSGLFRLIFDNENRCLLNQFYAKVCDIGYFDDGTPFYGFEESAALFKMSVCGITGDSVIRINKLSNQLFTSSSSAATPAFAFLGDMPEDCYRDINTVFTIPQVTAYSVLQGTKHGVTATIRRGGTIIYSNMNVSGGYNFTLSDYANYNITFTAGGGDSGRYTIHVPDKIPPEITVNGSIAQEYKLNSTLTIPAASASDNYSGAEKILLYVLVRDPENYYSVVAQESVYTFTKAGNYEIVYYAKDEAGNAAQTVYKVRVA